MSGSTKRQCDRTPLPTRPRWLIGARGSFPQAEPEISSLIAHLCCKHGPNKSLVQMEKKRPISAQLTIQRQIVDAVAVELDAEQEDDEGSVASSAAAGLSRSRDWLENPAAPASQRPLPQQQQLAEPEPRNAPDPDPKPRGLSFAAVAEPAAEAEPVLHLGQTSSEGTAGSDDRQRWSTGSDAAKPKGGRRRAAGLIRSH